MKSIISPLLTEKSAADIDKGLYAFYITKSANKSTVAAELKELHDVVIKSVRIVNLPFKNVTFKRVRGKQSVRRKAYVQLDGKKAIPGFEVLKENKEAAEKEMAKEAKEAAKETK